MGREGRGEQTAHGFPFASPLQGECSFFFPLGSDLPLLLSLQYFIEVFSLIFYRGGGGAGPVPPATSLLLRSLLCVSVS